MATPAALRRYLREVPSANGRADAALPAPEQAARGVLLVGAGGLGREVHQYVADAIALEGGYYLKGFLDDRSDRLPAANGNGLAAQALESYRFEVSDRVILTIGNPEVRLRLAAQLEARGASFLTIVHPLAYVADSARIGTGCIVAPFATVGALASVGDHSFLAYYSSVAHDAEVGRASALSPHAVTNGGSRLGEGVFLGTFAVVNPLQTVGDGAKVAAGAVVYHPVPARTLAVGNPAKPRPLWS